MQEQIQKIIEKAIERGYLLLSLPYESVEYKHKWLICTLKPQYQVNGKKVQEVAIASVLIDPLFWQGLGKACKGNKQWIGTSGVLNPWEQRALDFYRINLTKGWEKAVEYIYKLTNNKDE